MSTPAAAIHVSFYRALIAPVLTLFIIPVSAMVLATCGQSKLDARVFESIDAAVERDATLNAEEKAQTKAFYRQHPPSQICTETEPELENYRSKLCDFSDESFQFLFGFRLGLFGVGLGLLAIVLAFVFAALAFGNRNLQYVSFVTGWRLLVLVSAVEIVLQGVLAVWLSFWSTAIFTQTYFVKLVGLAAIFALMGIYAALKGVFQKPQPRAPIDAEPIVESDAQPIWQRVRSYAARLQTAPPDNIVAGVDDNFFVTQVPLLLHGGRTVSGRTLYVSLPLLRVLSQEEADAVLGHELTHFSGGDTASSARLMPLLVSSDLYLHSLATGVLNLPAFYLLRMYRVFFDLALSKEQRAREFNADKTSASLTSPLAMVNSLMKVAAYSSFRHKTESALFEQTTEHTGALDIAKRVVDGWTAHVASEHFFQELQSVSVPHPFDSHPPLSERVQALGLALSPTAMIDSVTVVPQKTWVQDILTADRIEKALWKLAEDRFTAAHRESLAYRYLPSTDEERQLVETYFPPVTFEGKKGTVRITYAAIEAPGWEQPLPFADTVSATVDKGNFTNALKIVYQHGGKPAPKPLVIQLGPLGKNEEPMRDAFARYWSRDASARKAQQQASAQSQSKP
jgi:Zn-dependent protease with chaperone function